MTGHAALDTQEASEGADSPALEERRSRAASGGWLGRAAELDPHTRSGLAHDLQRQAGNRAPARLTQGLVLARLKDPMDKPDASTELAQLQATAGYQALSTFEQGQIDALIDSTLPFATGQKAALATFLADASKDKDKPATIRTWVKERTGAKVLGYISRPVPSFVNYRDARVGAATTVDNKRIEGDGVSYKCERFEMDLNGVKIPIFRPDKQPKTTDGVWPTIEEILSFFDHVPRIVAALIKEVHLNVEPYGHDRTKDPWSRGFMSAGQSGVMNIHPYPDWAGTNISVVHESGHVISQQAWGGGFAKRWKPWKDAIKADGVRVSTYAYQSVEEDFADTYALWATNHGTPNEWAMRAFVPNRLAILEPMAAGAEKKVDDAIMDAAKAKDAAASARYEPDSI